jgi:hypothetical protein
MHGRKHARILVTVCIEKFYHSLLKLEVIGTYKHTEQFQGLITNYFSDSDFCCEQGAERYIKLSGYPT